MTASIERVKVEILLDAPLVDLVTKIVEGAGAGGYTLLTALAGSGRNGRWSEDRVSGADTKLLLLAIAKNKTAERIVRGVEPLLDTHGLIVIYTRVGVVRDSNGRWAAVSSWRSHVCAVGTTGEGPTPDGQVFAAVTHKAAVLQPDPVQQSIVFASSGKRTHVRSRQVSHGRG